jgi:hypothetical protein
VKPLFLIRQRELCDLNGEGNPYGLVLDLRERRARCRQRGYRVLQRQLQQALHSLTP